MKKIDRTIYFKKSCITCKKSLSEIERMKIDIQKRDFFKDPFSEKELKKIIKMAGIKPKDMIRKRDKMYKELAIESKKYSDEEIIKFMIEYPGLIMRPIIVFKNKAYAGKTSFEDLQN